jgi:hypothetical protein
MYGIFDKSSADSHLLPQARWVKFITPTFPCGLLSGIKSAKKYASIWDARNAIDDMLLNQKYADDIRWIVNNLEARELPKL